MLLIFKDLSDNAQLLASIFKKYRNPLYTSSSSKENDSAQNSRVVSSKQHLLFSEMAKLITSPSVHRRHHSNRLSRQTLRPSSFVLLNGTKPFDDSIYESNQLHHS